MLLGLEGNQGGVWGGGGSWAWPAWFWLGGGTRVVGGGGQGSMSFLPPSHLEALAIGNTIGNSIGNYIKNGLLKNDILNYI